MSAVGCELTQLEEALSDKTPPLKLAETRLETRLRRPHSELLHDDAQQTLCSEVLQLRNSSQRLAQQISETKTTYNTLEQQIYHLDCDIKCKNQALMLLMRCSDLRNALGTLDDQPPSF